MNKLRNIKQLLSWWIIWHLSGFSRKRYRKKVDHLYPTYFLSVTYHLNCLVTGCHHDTCIYLLVEISNEATVACQYACVWCTSIVAFLSWMSRQQQESYNMRSAASATPLHCQTLMMSSGPDIMQHYSTNERLCQQYRFMFLMGEKWTSMAFVIKVRGHNNPVVNYPVQKRLLGNGSRASCVH